MSKQSELDEILERYRLHANMAYSEVEDGFHTAEEFKRLALPKTLDEARQAITSLIKELVAEAKPHYTSKPNHNFGTTHETGMSEGYNLAIDEFEQNLLKALEEV